MAARKSHRPRSRPLAERFWEKVSPEPMSGCFLWTGTIDHEGYGHIRVAGKRRARAHRVSFAMANGRESSTGLDHVCRNRACVNAQHLREADHLLNAANGHWALKSACPKGHPYDAENTYRDPKGHRFCRKCNRAAVASYAKRKKVPS